jgi:hypothetical protein
MTTDNFCVYLQNRLIQTSQTGGQWYSDTSPFSIPWFVVHLHVEVVAGRVGEVILALAVLKRTSLNRFKPVPKPVLRPETRSLTY